jgi:hypothetical protein
MHRPIPKLSCALAALILVATASQALARDHSRNHGARHSYAGHPARGYSTYYPRGGYYPSRYYGSPYYYRGRSWYRPYGPRYVVVAPSFGVGVGVGVSLGVLPPYYTTVWFGGSPYYFADNTYYTYRSERREYVVTEPPRGSDESFAYPRNGQSEEQQATDRDECHRWAVARTGFDPTRRAGNVAGTDMRSKKVDYRRAETACLDARGYSVR